MMRRQDGTLGKLIENEPGKFEFVPLTEGEIAEIEPDVTYILMSADNRVIDTVKSIGAREAEVYFTLLYPTWKVDKADVYLRLRRD